MPDKRSNWTETLLDWLRDPTNAHWKLALYWPIYSVAYVLIGKLGGRIDPICTALPLDSHIPFVAAFIVPYLLWFPFWVVLLVYALIREPVLFRRTMHFFMVTNPQQRHGGYIP